MLGGYIADQQGIAARMGKQGAEFLDTEIDAVRVMQQDTVPDIKTEQLTGIHKTMDFQVIGCGALKLLLR